MRTIRRLFFLVAAATLVAPTMLNAAEPPSQGGTMQRQGEPTGPQQMRQQHQNRYRYGDDKGRWQQDGRTYDAAGQVAPGMQRGSGPGARDGAYGAGRGGGKPGGGMGPGGGRGGGR